MNMNTWKKYLRGLLDDIWDDSDHPDCPKCNGTMNFYGHDEEEDFDYGDGYWKCPDCRFMFFEDEL